jgi:DNA-binding NtrC family response regulator
MSTETQSLWTVFVIDDDDDNRELTAMLLTSRGATVLTAGSFDEALGRLSEATPNLVLCDLSLGSHSGEEVLAAFRARGCTADVWAMTGHDTAPDGFRGLLRKPFGAEKLDALVRQSGRS